MKEPIAKFILQGAKFVTKIAIEYANSNIAIVSSLYEGFGYPVAEAMACSVPLIATNAASIPEITHDYAELIPVKDHQGIGTYIEIENE